MPRIYNKLPRPQMETLCAADLLPRDIVRFSSYVRRQDGCWTWAAQHSRRGYGQFRFRDRTVGAHRISWIIANGGPVPAGLWILHRCNNPGCVNPNHLYPGTVQQNVADMLAAGNQCYGEKSNFAKISAETVGAILEDYYFHKNTTAVISTRRGISQEHASAIIRGKFWPIAFAAFMRSRGITDPRSRRAEIMKEHKAEAQPRGVTYGCCKLTEPEVAEIRSLIGIQPYSAIARRFGVTVSGIEAIALGISWKSVEWAKREARA